MKKSVIGILAHVDAGKTTLSDALLLEAGCIRSGGRVDHGDSFLDSDREERRRGITIYAKEAVLKLPERTLTLVDTPGHVDFSPEAERALDILDAAVLVISGSEGVQSHTVTLWKLLRKRGLPVFLFINKMDLPGPGRDALLCALRGRLGGCFFDAEAPDPEEIASSDEKLLDEYLQTGCLSDASVTAAVRRAEAYPCRFGSALKGRGVREFLQDLEKFAPDAPELPDFSAKVYKITHDPQGVRLTHMKLTGGVLHPRNTVRYLQREEKITQLRSYSGPRFTALEEASAGDVVAAAGLSGTYPGMCLGSDAQGLPMTLLPVQSYALVLPEGTDPMTVLPKLRELAEEEPSLAPQWEEETKELTVQLMGPVQREIFRELLERRFGLQTEFGPGKILYRETVKAPAEGIGHYEPLRHYAEVHLLLEPAPRGSGLSFGTACSTDELALNWQRLVLTHLQEKVHRGVLTGAPITDMKITLLSGRAHEKHTEGGDFREATYRALRQGLMRAESELLEPIYDFELTVPAAMLGRAMTDLEKMKAKCEPPQTGTEECTLRGRLPASELGTYPEQLASYSRGQGRLTLAFGGYEPCAGQAAVIAEAGYQPEADLANTPDSVFCAHGAGFNVNWRDVPRYMHLPFAFAGSRPKVAETSSAPAPARSGGQLSGSLASDAELMAIFERTYGKPKTDRPGYMRPARENEQPLYRGREDTSGERYLLVDGYNVIFSWESLRDLAAEDLEAARSVLTDRLRNFQGYRGCRLILVFDAYKVKGNPGSVERKGDFTVVFTKEAETADMYIEKATYRLSGRSIMQVVTSDALEQVIILGHGALRVPARSFEAEVIAAENEIREQLSQRGSAGGANPAVTACADCILPQK